MCSRAADLFTGRPAIAMADSALGQFISFFVRVFWELVQLTIDLACLPFLLVALLMPWRSPFLIHGVMTGGDQATRTNYRFRATSQCAIGVFEGATFLVALLVLFSGLRTAKLVEKLQTKTEWDSNFNCNSERLFAIWEQFFKLLRDIIPFCFLLLLLAMPWRWPSLVRAMRREGLGWLFQTICPCTTPKEKRVSETDILWDRWVIQPLLGAIDLVTAFPLAIVLLTGIRARKLLKKLRSKEMLEHYDKDYEYNMAARGLVWKQFGSLLVDAIFVPLALLVALSGWRTLSLVHLLRGDKKGMAKRLKAIKLFFSMIIDVPFLLFGLFAALTPWRTRELWTELKLSDRKLAEAPQTRRTAAADQAYSALLDWVHVLMGSFVLLLVPWRAAYLWREIRLLDASTQPAAPANENAHTSGGERRVPCASDRREYVRDHFYGALIDIPHIIMGALVFLLCPWRAKLLWNEAKPWPGAHADPPKRDTFSSTVASPIDAAPADVEAASGAQLGPPLDAEARRMAALEHFFSMLVDFIVILMATIVFVTGWRAPLLARDIRLCDLSVDADVRWGVVAVHFVRLLRDLPFVLLTPLTLYRLPGVVIKLMATQKSLLVQPPALTLTAAYAACDANGRLRLRVDATKPAQLAANQLKITAGGEAFWEAVLEKFGSVASVARSVLPYKVAMLALALFAPTAHPTNPTLPTPFADDAQIPAGGQLAGRRGDRHTHLHRWRRGQGAAKARLRGRRAICAAGAVRQAGERALRTGRAALSAAWRTART